VSLEHSPARQGERAAFTVREFCDAHRISRSMLYKLWAQGTGPRIIKIGTKILISAEAAADWRREREATARADADGSPA
jgi:predicted DNA-binding transcriptional regulator AlpA